MLDMKRLKQQALEIRRLTIEEIGNFGSSHLYTSDAADE